MAQSVTKNDLMEMDEKYGGDEMYKIFGYSLLTSPCGIDSSRLNMVSQHVKQQNVLGNPDIARLRTGFENTFGQRSHGYKMMEGRWQVVDKICKYGDKGIYMLILYNKKKDTYDMVEKVFANGFSEKQGYVFNTKFMDSLVVGDEIEDDVLYKSTSFDDHMNYRMGKSAKVMNITTNDTQEDALRVRMGWAMGCQWFEVDNATASVNNNDIPKNIYGTANDYRSIPDIGSKISNNSVFVTTRLNSKHILTQFREQKLRTVTSLDDNFVTGKHAILYDIDIYYNGDGEFPDNIFYHQLKGYYDQKMEYMKNVYEAATKIKYSGSKYTRNVTYYRDLYNKDAEHPWIAKKEFDFMVIEFHTISINPLALGSKLTGRYGNKGVISSFANDVKRELVDSIIDSYGINSEDIDLDAMNIEFVPDENMPYTDDGPVDIEFDSSAAVRRLIMDSTHEVELNFIGRQIQLKIQELETYEEKRALAYDYITMMNEFDAKVYSQLFYNEQEVDGYMVKLMAPEWEKKFIESIEKNGFYICKPPHHGIRYDEIKRLYQHFDWIKPIPIYINRFGIKHRMLHDGIVGEMQIMILKQNTNKNFSARSTYRMNRANLPAKDNAKKTNRSTHAKTPIKLSELYGLFSAMSGRDIAEWNVFMRSSTLGRKALGKILTMKGNPLLLKKLNLDREFLNTNAEMLLAKLKVIGIGLRFVTQAELDGYATIDDDFPRMLNVGPWKIYDLPENRRMYQYIYKNYKEVRSSMSIVETYPDEAEDIIWEETFKREELKEFTISDETKVLLRNLTRKHPVDIIDEDSDENPDPYGLEVKLKRHRRTKAEMGK